MFPSYKDIKDAVNNAENKVRRTVYVAFKRNVYGTYLYINQLRYCIFRYLFSMPISYEVVQAEIKTNIHCW